MEGWPWQSSLGPYSPTCIKGLPKGSPPRPIRPDPHRPSSPLLHWVGSPWVGSKSLYDKKDPRPVSLRMLAAELQPIPWMAGPY